MRGLLRHVNVSSMRTTNSRRGRLSSRPFYTTVLLLSLFTAYSFLLHTTQRRAHDAHDDGRSLLRRKDDVPECREVHTAFDQCAFVKEYCVDDDAGLLPYLRLYYCAFGKAQPVAFAILVVWLGLLFTTIGIAASDFFSVNLSTIATILGLSESLAGVTFLAFGNGSPDVFSTFAAMSSNSASMAVGELIGAASFITGVVAGSMALVREFRVDRKTYARDICFFIVAVGFTMVFLADGELHFWECCAMVGYYVVYVVTVVGWHWYTTRRKWRLRREGEARSHFYGLAGSAGDELAGEPYRDDPDIVTRQTGQASPNLRPEGSLLSSEAGPRIEIEGQAAGNPDYVDSDEAADDHERMVAAEVTRSMRVLRPHGQRRNTLTPIRPSLVGALEFRSALAQLNRESNLQLSAIPARSYSENHIDNRERRGSTSVIPDLSLSEYQISSASANANAKNGRDRAMSYAYAPNASLPPSGLLDPGQDNPDPSLLTPSEPEGSQRSPSPTSSYVVGGRLAPPPGGQIAPGNESSGLETHGETVAPRLQLQIPSRRSSYSDGSSVNTPFPQYTDSPMAIAPHQAPEHGATLSLPPAAMPAGARRENSFPSLHLAEDMSRPVSWWPYSLLPAPHVLLATLFPTLQGWREKAIWDKILSTISVPSIFLLVITLPVVESETTEGSIADLLTDISSHGVIGHVAPPISIQPGQIEPEGEWERYRRHSIGHGSSRRRSTSNAPPPLVSIENEDTLVVPSYSGAPGVPKPLSETHSLSHASEDKLQWNRWLVCLQMFTGPIFAVFILWANMLDDWENPRKALVRMILWTLLGSTVLLGTLLLCTTDQKRPKYHFLFCFLGFIISIAWISTIAGEVVGVLKTFGVLLGISEALLGLTIFAAGNSVGDLVADITVARLGYPVMALSACFGGPMLNILLGIGIGGALMMVRDANHHQRKHPDRKYKYKPYRVQIGGTLMISSVTLLVILVGLLISVPMNKWVLSRKIGWVLIAMWTLSTIANVVVEVTGAIGDLA